MVEMTAPSADGRITHGCPGLWNDQQTDDFARIVDWVHAKSDAKIGLQIGHAGPKGSTCRPWQGRAWTSLCPLTTQKATGR
jgi:anthraniloyl-CoA monooxygenase